MSAIYYTTGVLDVTWQDPLWTIRPLIGGHTALLRLPTHTGYVSDMDLFVIVPFTWSYTTLTDFWYSLLCPYKITCGWPKYWDNLTGQKSINEFFILIFFFLFSTWWATKWRCCSSIQSNVCECYVVRSTKHRKWGDNKIWGKNCINYKKCGSLSVLKQWLQDLSTTWDYLKPM